MQRMWGSAFVLPLFLAGCSGLPQLSAPVSAPAVLSPQAGSSSSIGRLSPQQANDVTVMAIGLVGTPYKYGGNTPESGFDCSGLIAYVYKERAAVVAPRTTAGLLGWGASIPPEALRSGDLLVFVQNGQASHAGIYVGEGRFVHAPSTGGTVRLDHLRTPYWARQQVTYRRP
jgi:cell wall-associated NlpC family hydrolase